MALYLTKLVNGQVQKLRVSPTKAIYRGFWAVIVGGFAGTSVTCNGVTKFIGSSERVAFNIITPGTYTFTATRQGTTITKEVVLNDDTPEYIINLSMFIGMQQLEYIESTGTQYIDTGIIPDENTNVKVKASYVEIIPSSQYDSVVGSTAGGVDYRFYPLGYTFSTGKIRQSYGSAQYEQTFDTNIHTVDFNNENKQVVVDDTVVGSTTSGFVKAENQPSLYLFATNVSGTPGWYGAVRLYSLQIYNNGTLASDFIPIKDDTGHGALYDNVTQQIFYNSGTGDFISGPNLYTELEYIESTGTQWIDTDVQFNSLTTSFDIVFETNYIPSNYTFLFGAGSSSSGNRFWLIVDSSNTQIGYGTQYYNAISVQNKKIRYKADIDETNVYFSFIDASTEQDILYVTKNKQNFVTNNNIFLFRTNPVQVAPDSTYRGKIYSCKIYDNNILVRDFIPALDKNGTPCMYDKVERKFYYNAGTGQFIAGPEKQ